VNGRKVLVKILALKDKYLVAAFSTNAADQKGYIMRSSNPKAVLKGLKQYDQIEAVVITRPTASHPAQLAVGPDAAERAAGAAEDEETIVALSAIKVGQQVEAVIDHVTSSAISVAVSANVTGTIAAVDASVELDVISDLKAHFKSGKVLKCTVLSVDIGKQELQLSIRPVVPLQVGDIVAANITGQHGEHITLQLPGAATGTVHVCDLADAFKKNPFKKIKRGKLVQACVLDIPAQVESDQLGKKKEKKKAKSEMKTEKKHIALSLRPSRVDGVPNEVCCFPCHQ